MMTKNNRRLVAPVTVAALLTLTGATAMRCEPVPVAPACVESGEHVFPWDPNGAACCPGLTAEVIAERDDATGLCVDMDGAMVCLACGDGQCGPGESDCNCPQDCPVPGCVEEGGATFPWDDDDPGCCPGLSAIGAADYDPTTGVCELLVGGALCAACGDGVCGVAETPCTCPQDCSDQCCHDDGGCPYANAPRCVGGYCVEAPPAGRCWTAEDCGEEGRCVDPAICPCPALCEEVLDPFGTCYQPRSSS